MPMTYFRRFRMVHDLRRASAPLAELPSNYEFHAWSPALIEAHAAAKYASFRSELDVNVFPCLGDPNGCLQLMKEIISRAGFAPEATWLLTWSGTASTNKRPASGQGIPVGTIQGIVTDEQTGTLQNIGVAPEHRGRGLGRLLIGKALAGFQSLGLSQAVLEVTAHNVSAIRLYRRLGFKFQRVVYKFQDVAWMR